MHLVMASSRPLPVPPPMARNYSPYDSPKYGDTHAFEDPYYSPYPYPPFTPGHMHEDVYDEPTTTLSGGTLLHKGFYDLLAMIPTPSPSRLFWGPPAAEPDPVVAGPRYEDIGPGGPNASGKPAVSGVPLSQNALALRKGRRISKDMVSRPTGFVYVLDPERVILSIVLTVVLHYSHLVHASDADQAEALLTRWGPDGMGKLGGQGLPDTRQTICTSHFGS